MTCVICSAPLHLLYNDIVDDRYGYPGSFRIYQCARCGAGRLDPLLTNNELQELYTKYYPRKTITPESVRAAAVYQAGLEFRLKNWLNGTTNICHYYVQPGTRVLDVGCGDGASLLEIQRQNAEAYGTEVDRNVASIAADMHLRITFDEHGTLQQPENFFDDITMNQLIEHIPDPAAFLRLAATKLKPGGRIIMSTPNIGSWNRRASGRRWVNWHVPFHVNFFSERSLYRLADAAGLHVERIATVTPRNWVIVQLLALLQPRPTPGKPNTFWQPRTAGVSIGQYLRQLGRAKAAGLLTAHFLGIITIPLWRFVDAFGYGDSFIVFLKKDNDEF